MSAALVLAQHDVTKGYKLDQRMFRPARAAHYLDWAAQKFPRVFIPYNVLVKSIMGYAKTPRADSEEVDRVRAMGGRIRNILLDAYGRSTITEAGKGIRASVDDEDMLKHCVTKASRRLLSARDSFVKVAEKVNISRVPACPEKTWFQRDAKEILKIVNTLDFEKHLSFEPES